MQIEKTKHCKLRKHLHLFDSTCAVDTHDTTKKQKALQIQNKQIRTSCKYAQTTLEM